MIYEINETHDPTLKSWVESANDPNADFPIQNLPFVTFKPIDKPWLHEPEFGVRIGDFVLSFAGIFHVPASEEFYKRYGTEMNEASLQYLAGSVTAVMRTTLRRFLIDILREDADNRTRTGVQQCLVPISDITLNLPYEIGDYTDFYCSIFHATNVGSMFRPDNPLLPNYKFVPIGYHGRASSIVGSGTPVPRAAGQLKGPNDAAPVFAPSRSLDYECEVGAFVGPGNPLGSAIP